MKDEKASRAMEYLDDQLIISAMDSTDLKESKKSMILGEKIMKNKAWKKWGSIAAAFVIVLSAALITGSLIANSSEAVIAFDVNPSIEIEINKKEEVKEIEALNADAEKVIGDMDLNGVDIDVAVNAIIGSMVQNGYLSIEQNSILISIDSKNGKKADLLKEKISEDISKVLGEKNITASVIVQSFDKKAGDSEKADKNNISAAKSALISKIVEKGLLDANGVPYSYETLAKLKVNQLKLILDSKSFNVDGVDFSGKASGSKYISAEEALDMVFDKAGIPADAKVQRLENEMDYDDDHNAMVYEIEFIYENMKYEYEISAENGNILEEEKEPVDRDDRDDGDDWDDDHNYNTEVATPENTISREKALEIVYAHAGVNANDVKRPEIELDREKGAYVYEIEFKAKGMEYEYKVDVATGEIIESEKEPID